MSELALSLAPTATRRTDLLPSLSRHTRRILQRLLEDRTLDTGHVDLTQLIMSEREELIKTTLKAYVKAGGLDRTRGVGRKTATELTIWCGATAVRPARVPTIRPQRARRTNAKNLLIDAAKMVLGMTQKDNPSEGPPSVTLE